MFRETVNALLACVVTIALCAVAYPAAVYGLGHTLFPGQARGSLIERDGKVVGSLLIAQPFASEKYFSPRPSAAGATGYAADAASGSNLGTTNPALHDRIALDVARQIASRTGDADLKTKLDQLDGLQAELKVKKEIKEPTQADTDAIAKLEEQVATAQARVLDRSAELGKSDDVRVPVDLVTASGAGLDPDISPEAARYQAPRVAAARRVPVDRVLKIIDGQINESGTILGAPPRVNVLLLNLDLDKEAPASPSSADNTPAPDAQPSAPVTETKATVPDALSASASPAVGPAPNDPPPASDRTVPSASVEALARQIDRLREKLDAAPVEGLAAEVKELNTRIAKLAESAEPAARRLAELETRVAGFGRDIQSLQTERNSSRPVPKADGEIASLGRQLQDLTSQVETLRESANKGATGDHAVSESARPLDLEPAIKLFREKRYGAAAGAFRALAEARPDDARSWYFAALATGLATGQWRGEAEDLVNKGVERERSGFPGTAEIDAAYVGLTKDTGKDWLSYYRRQVKR
jgi:K+-transporting ATPase KdpC subunit